MTLRAHARTALASLLMCADSPLQGVSVLCFHSIQPHRSGFITDSTETLERVARVISEKKIETIFASDVPRFVREYPGRAATCITFDDGYEDNLTHALPILERFNVKATVFLITDLIGGSFTDSSGTERALLSEAQVRELAWNPLIECMPHSHTHRDFDSLNDVEQRQEIIRSRDIIAAYTGRVPTVFAYPRGRYGSSSGDILKECGFEAAFGTDPGIFTAHSNLFDIPRNFLGDVSDAEIALRFSNRMSTYARLKRYV